MVFILTWALSAGSRRFVTKTSAVAISFFRATIASGWPRVSRTICSKHEQSQKSQQSQQSQQQR